MARDYKPVTRRGGTMEGVVPFLLGLALGLSVALMVYFQKQPNLPAAKPVLTQKEAPREPLAAKPRFDFYTILPEQKVKEPTQDVKIEEQTERKNVRQSHVLQVGSFRDFQDADQRKASLALLGMSARIERVVLNGGHNRYRVRMGPFPQSAQLEAMRSRLEQNEIDFITLRRE